jgi:hypothetical protein
MTFDEVYGLSIDEYLIYIGEDLDTTINRINRQLELLYKTKAKLADEFHKSTTPIWGEVRDKLKIINDKIQDKEAKINKYKKLKGE